MAIEVGLLARGRWSGVFFHATVELGVEKGFSNSFHEDMILCEEVLSIEWIDIKCLEGH